MGIQVEPFNVLWNVSSFSLLFLFSSWTTEKSKYREGIDTFAAGKNQFERKCIGQGEINEMLGLKQINVRRNQTNKCNHFKLSRMSRMRKIKAKQINVTLELENYVKAQAFKCDKYWLGASVFRIGFSVLSRQNYSFYKPRTAQQLPTRSFPYAHFVLNIHFHWIMVIW